MSGAVIGGFWFWQAPSWHWAYAWAAVTLLLPTLVGMIARWASSMRPRPVLDVLNGVDGRWSTSKCSFVLWTAALWWALLAILIHTRGGGGTGLENHEAAYAVLLGIPAAAAVGAKAITESKVDAGAITTKTPRGPETNLVKGISQIFANDDKQTDLLDSQYFGFSLILLGYFLFRFTSNPDLGLPDLPDALLALSSVSAAAYVSRKGLAEGTVNPEIRSVIPARGAPGDTIRVRGINLATAAAADVGVLFGDLEGAVTRTDVDTFGASITTAVPATAIPGIAELRVVAYDGRRTEPIQFTVT